ncbi:MAG: HEAT repeat domain-containing protein [Proteobacteria bacterium]|nr:HEAT repeat domain-containing protein [Pseudomonadota bacterium]
MPETQLNLFSSSALTPERRRQGVVDAPAIVPAELDDDTLLAAILQAGLTDILAVIAEVERRGLAAAIPVLERLCLRFTGFGADQPIPEQIAALGALAAIGGRDAAATVTRLMVKAVVQGPTLNVAVNVAARLGCHLPGAMVHRLLAHDAPEVRANACRCARPAPGTIALLIGLLDDLNGEVNAAAACALGRMGRREALPMLSRMLRGAPSVEIIEAISRVADEDCIILLGRILQTDPGFSDAARDALEAASHPRAARILAVRWPEARP